MIIACYYCCLAGCHDKLSARFYWFKHLASHKFWFHLEKIHICINLVYYPKWLNSIFFFFFFKVSLPSWRAHGCGGTRQWGRPFGWPPRSGAAPQLFLYDSPSCHCVFSSTGAALQVTSRLIASQPATPSPHPPQLLPDKNELQWLDMWGGTPGAIIIYWTVKCGVSTNYGLWKGEEVTYSSGKSPNTSNL